MKIPFLRLTMCALLCSQLVTFANPAMAEWNANDIFRPSNLADIKAVDVEIHALRASHWVLSGLLFSIMAKESINERNGITASTRNGKFIIALSEDALLALGLGVGAYTAESVLRTLPNGEKVSRFEIAYRQAMQRQIDAKATALQASAELESFTQKQASSSRLQELIALRTQSSVEFDAAEGRLREASKAYENARTASPEKQAARGELAKARSAWWEARATFDIRGVDVRLFQSQRNSISRTLFSAEREALDRYTSSVSELKALHRDLKPSFIYKATSNVRKLGSIAVLLAVIGVVANTVAEDATIAFNLEELPQVKAGLAARIAQIENRMAELGYVQLRTR